MSDNPDNKLSVLGDLKRRHAERVKAAYIDLEVPRWDEPVPVVRYRPVDHETIRAGQEKIRKVKEIKKRALLEVDINAGLLADACEFVFCQVDGEMYGFDTQDPGRLGGFDEALAENLGMTPPFTAKQIVRELYFTDGDILSAAAAIVRHSGYTEAEADDELSGE